MALGLLLLPAVGGYWFLTHWNYTRFRAVRESGYHLLFNSALYGIPLYVGARLVTFVLDLLYPPLTAFWDVHVPEPFTSEVMLSLAFGYFAPMYLNRRFKRFDLETCARRTAEEFGDHIELVIDQAMQDEELVELSLRSRKSYVGYARESGIGKFSDTDVILVPVLSGYRDEKSLDLKLEANYGRVIYEYIQGNPQRTSRPFEDFKVIIPLSEVVSARMFDEELYRAFQQRPAEDT